MPDELNPFSSQELLREKIKENAAVEMSRQQELLNNKDQITNNLDQGTNKFSQQIDKLDLDSENNIAGYTSTEIEEYAKLGIEKYQFEEFEKMNISKDEIELLQKEYNLTLPDLMNFMDTMETHNPDKIFEASTKYFYNRNADLNSEKMQEIRQYGDNPDLESAYFVPVMMDLRKAENAFPSSQLSNLENKYIAENRYWAIYNPDNFDNLKKETTDIFEGKSQSTINNLIYQKVMRIYLSPASPVSIKNK